MADVPSQRYSCQRCGGSFFQDASGEQTTVEGMCLPGQWFESFFSSRDPIGQE